MKKTLIAFGFLFFAFSCFAQTVGASSEGGKPLEAAPSAGAASSVDGEPQKPEDDPKIKNALVTFLDLEYAFKNHPWTVMAKQKFSEDIKNKSMELNNVQGEINRLKTENIEFSKEIENVKPFYVNVYVEPETPLLPKQQENVNANEFDNLISFFVFSGAEQRAYSPVDAPEILDEIEKTIRENREKIKEKELYIEKERASSRSNIQTAESADVQEILEDIYATLKIYAQKRNIQAVVNKKDILFGQKPVDITLDFTDRLKKEKKKRPKTKEKDKKEIVKIGLD